MLKLVVPQVQDAQVGKSGNVRRYFRNGRQKQLNFGPLGVGLNLGHTQLELVIRLGRRQGPGRGFVFKNEKTLSARFHGGKRSKKPILSTQLEKALGAN